MLEGIDRAGNLYFVGKIFRPFRTKDSQENHLTDKTLSSLTPPKKKGRVGVEWCKREREREKERERERELVREKEK